MIFKNWCYFQICDRIKYPTIVSILGNILLTVAFLLVGPVPFLTNILPTTSLIQGSAAILGAGYAMVMVSTFGRSQSAAIRNGYNDDLDTYMFISSKQTFIICNLNCDWNNPVKSNNAKGDQRLQKWNILHSLSVLPVSLKKVAISMWNITKKLAFCFSMCIEPVCQ